MDVVGEGPDFARLEGVSNFETFDGVSDLERLAERSELLGFDVAAPASHAPTAAPPTTIVAVRFRFIGCSRGW